ncbi:MAG: hypothetical protein J1E85_09050 [Ruminococcus sp.]|nr:hypothetical protein [Ruminococcus sp.]
MKDIDSSTKNAIINNLIENVLSITVVAEDGIPRMTIYEENMISESMILKQSICDESDLKFGGCIASEFNIDLIDTESKVFSNNLVGKWIYVNLKQTFTTNDLLYPKNTLYPSLKRRPGNTESSKTWCLFWGFIDSAQRDQNNKNIRHIVAYDRFAKMYQTDATNILYNYIKSGAKFGTILKGCLSIPISDHVNDVLSTVINKTTNLTLNDMPIFNDDWLKDNSNVTKGEVVRMCCEMLGGFGVIVPDGSSSVFDIVFFYDSNLYGKNAESYDFYEQLYSEEYITYGYNYLLFSIGGNSRNEKVKKLNSEIGTRTEERIYDFTENILCWQESDGTGNPTTSNTNIINLIHDFSGLKMYAPQYTPMSATLDGRPWVECGDTIRIVVNQTDTEGNYIYDEKGNIETETVKSFMLSRTLTGIKALTDEIEAKGD